MFDNSGRASVSEVGQYPPQASGNYHPNGRSIPEVSADTDSTVDGVAPNTVLRRSSTEDDVVMLSSDTCYDGGSQYRPRGSNSTQLYSRTATAYGGAPSAPATAANSGTTTSTSTSTTTSTTTSTSTSTTTSTTTSTST
eukprot:Lankesteria_metandrocarpae@DN8927_c0_g1_i1.p1